MESISLKCSSIQMGHLIELKFGMYIIGHHPTYCVEFGEFRINSFFYRSSKKNSSPLQPVESNCKKYASVNSTWKCQISYYTCNFYIFIEIFTNSKYFKYLAINKYSES